MKDFLTTYNMKNYLGSEKSICGKMGLRLLKGLRLLILERLSKAMFILGATFIREVRVVLKRCFENITFSDSGQSWAKMF